MASSTMKPEPLSTEFLLQQGSCCGSHCLNCPYVDEAGKKHVVGSTKVRRELRQLSETELTSELTLEDVEND